MVECFRRLPDELEERIWEMKSIMEEHDRIRAEEQNIVRLIDNAPSSRRNGFGPHGSKDEEKDISLAILVRRQ